MLVRFSPLFGFVRSLAQARGGNHAGAFRQRHGNVLRELAPHAHARTRFSSFIALRFGSDPNTAYAIANAVLFQTTDANYTVNRAAILALVGSDPATELPNQVEAITRGFVSVMTSRALGHCMEFMLLLFSIPGIVLGGWLFSMRWLTTRRAARIYLVLALSACAIGLITGVALANPPTISPMEYDADEVNFLPLWGMLFAVVSGFSIALAIVLWLCTPAFGRNRRSPD